MTITDVKIRFVNREPISHMLAILSVTFDDMLTVHDIKVVKGTERVFVAMPSRKDESGIFRDIVHPINSQTRKMIEDVVLEAYENYVKDPRNQETEAETATEFA